MICCLTSSYFFAYVAAFYHPDGFWWWGIEIFYELIFLLDIVRNFLTEYQELGEKLPTRDFPKIASNYMRGLFIIDLIPLIPCVHLNMAP